MPVILGGPAAYKVRRHGDITVSYEWVNEEPAMCLFRPAFQMTKNGCVICLSAAFKYADPRTGGPTHYLMAQAFEFAKMMGIEMNKSSIRRIVDIVVDGLPDLLNMPPEPTKQQVTGHKDRPGEIALKIDGETVYENEIELQ